MQDFLFIAAAHFLSLLSPGPDFFLIARTSLAHGWRAAAGTCVGITVANAVFIVAAFGGLSVLQAGSTAFTVVRLAGCAYLLYLGWLFLRHAGKSRLDAKPASGKTRWRGGVVMGFMSAILNPKNALFYVSLATVLTARQTSPAAMAGLARGWCAPCWRGIWRWRWPSAAAPCASALRALPLLERLSGVMLIVLAVVLLVQAGSGSR